MNAGCEDDNEAEFSDDEELELFLKAYDEGQVRICCEWTAAPLASEGRTEAVDEPYRRKVAVWKRSWAAEQQEHEDEQQQESEDEDPMDDDDDDEDLTRALDEWEEESAVAEAVDRAIEEHYALETTTETSPASPPPPPAEDWKTPRNAILYTTRRWEVVPRASKRLEAKEHARWVAAAQASIDAEDEWRRTSEELGVDEKLAAEQLRRRRTSTTKRKKTKRKKKKMLTPRSKLLAVGSERSTARRNLAKLDFK